MLNCEPSIHPYLFTIDPLIPQLNRAFCAIIDGTPRIQHEAELFAVALEGSTRVDFLDLADRRTALEKYRTRWENVEHADED